MPARKHSDCIMVDRVVALEEGMADARADQGKVLQILGEVRIDQGLLKQAIVGNGVKGLAERMSDQERATSEIAKSSITPEKVKEIAHATVHAVIENARRRDKTMVEKLKAIGPWAIPAALLVMYVMQNVFHWGAPPVVSP